MTDSVALVRNSENKIVMAQRKKILHALALPPTKLDTHYKITIEHWFAKQPTVTTGSAIETALNMAAAQVGLY